MSGHFLCWIVAGAGAGLAAGAVWGVVLMIPATLDIRLLLITGVMGLTMGACGGLITALLLALAGCTKGIAPVVAAAVIGLGIGALFAYSQKLLHRSLGISELGWSVIVTGGVSGAFAAGIRLWLLR